MEWLIRMNDDQLLQQETAQLIEEATSLSDFMQIVASFDSDFKFSQGYSFIANFQSFQLAKPLQMEKAKKHALDLLEDQTVPLRLRASLFTEIVPQILSSQEVALTNQELFQVMTELENLHIYLELHNE